jgi:hypothetical protein
MAGLAAFGLGALVERPKLEAPEVLALEVWHFMGGWAPERLDIACEWFDVRDPERLVMGLLTIRDEVNKR